MSLIADRPAGSPAESRRIPRPAVLVAALGTVGIVVSLMQTLVIPIVPLLPGLLGTDATNASWVVTATLLAGAVAMPISGRLGDMFGKRRMVLVSLLMLVTGSLVCALASSLAPVIVGRVLQGFATGAIALGISIMRDELPPERVGSAIASMSATFGVGSAVGLPLAAVIAQHAHWHVLFWTSAGLGAVCAVLVFTLVPESPVRTPARFDYLGAVGLSVTLVALLVVITKGTAWGWSSRRVLGLSALAAVAALLWGWYELRRTAPLVDLRVSARPRVLLTNLASIAVGFALYGMSLTFPQLLLAPTATGHGFGLSMIEAGLALAPTGLLMMLLSPVSARVTAARGPKLTLALGATVLGLGYLSATLWTGAVWQIVLAACTVAAGVGLAYSAMPALIMGAVPVTETAAANGLNALMRAIGTSTSAAVMSAVLANLTVGVAGDRLPSREGFVVAFLVSGAAAVLAVLITVFIPATRPYPGRASRARVGSRAQVSFHPDSA
ncbi:MFS transporter [Nocardia farcinica]|uniref:MFS transporter n=1 Tax=Nocardia farcinica TaxID=37329 RepID=UPI000C01D1BC|nr:MFS transporter [Nocardia farcinica]PFX00297.1 Multidrug resistance protein 3 [Nocardia farcinica]PFX07831.1 Multidrug resistance protein 3 [Nocardia farcinica]